MTSSTPRMRSEDRREQILGAATRVFGDFGYVGATTDQVARAAGVSQPYVVRMFGGKQQLFLDVLKRALGRILETFESALPGDDAGRSNRLGQAYGELARDEGLLLSLMHGFVLGRDPVIGAAARAGFMQVVDFLHHRAGMTMQEASDFIAGGMLINTLVGLRMSESLADYPEAAELLDCAFAERRGVA
jgi:AcrR family transcriptional regulator